MSGGIELLSRRDALRLTLGIAITGATAAWIPLRFDRLSAHAPGSEAIAKFMTELSASRLSDPQAFHASIRQSLFAKLSQSHRDSIVAFVRILTASGYPLSWSAYAFATTYHETGATLRPILENLNYRPEGLLKTFNRYGKYGKPISIRITPEQANALGRVPGRPAQQEAIANIVYGGEFGRKQMDNNEPGDGWKYRGRGYVQVTGRRNYARADRVLGLGGALIRDPDRALRPDIAASILSRGMVEAWFTKYGLASFLPASGPADRARFFKSRQIINGTDKADVIANYAMDWQAALRAGGWRETG